MNNRLTILSLGYLALFAGAVVTAPPWLWGLDVAGVGVWPKVVFVSGLGGLFLFCLVPELHHRLRRAGAGLSSPLHLACAVLLLSLFGQSAVHLLGDRYLRIRELDAEAWEELTKTDRAPLTFWALILIILVIRAVRQSRALTFPAIVLGVLTALHFSAAFLFPCLVFAAYLSHRTCGYPKHILELTAYPTSSFVLLWLIGFDFQTYLSTLLSHTLPVTGDLPEYAAYHLLSLSHGVDLINALMLTASSAVILLPSLNPKHRLSDNVSATLASCCVACLRSKRTARTVLDQPER